MDYYLEVLESGLTRWGPAVVFVALFLECLPVVGFWVPGLTIVVVAGLLSAGQPVTQYGILILAAFGGMLISDSAAFLVGRFGAQRSRLVRRVLLRHDRLRRELGSQPSLVLLFYQFPPYSRMLAPLILGGIGIAPGRWILIVVSGTTMFVGCFFFVGRIAAELGRGATGAALVTDYLGAIALIAFLGWLGVLLLRSRRPAGEREGSGVADQSPPSS